MEAVCLTDKEYWQSQTGRFQAFEVGDNEFSPVLERFLPVNPDFTCVEIGAYPGTYLCYLAKTFGYKPTAIEYRDDADDIRKLFEFNGLDNLEIINKSFFEVEGLSFDVVASFGFIEHFIDYERVIKHHVDMLKPGGYLILSVPHFWGLQGILRRLVLRKEAVAEIHRTHNMQIMHLGALKNVLMKLGLVLLYGRYAMGGSFWMPSTSPKVRPFMRWLLYFFNKTTQRLGDRLPSSALYSPMVLTICQKKGMSLDQEMLRR